MIRQIGIEIEGGWLPDRIESYIGNHVYRHDGSVSMNSKICECGSNNDCECPRLKYVGECAFLPKEEIDIAISELLESYPDKTNNSCGLHVHISLTNFEYTYLIWNWKEFYQSYMKFLRIFGETRKIRSGSAFWERLNVGNQYCQLNINKRRVNRQLQNYGDSRYCHLNFCYCKHKTIEFRSAPAFQKKSLSADYVKSLYDFVNTYLIFAEKKFKSKIMELEI